MTAVTAEEQTWLGSSGKTVKRLLISYFSASGNVLLSDPKILLGGRTDSKTDIHPATCNI